MTKYRKIDSGTWVWLQYLDVQKRWWGTKKKWRFIWWPHCDYITGTSFGIDPNYSFPDSGAYVNNWTVGDLNKFVEKWPDIDEYYKWAEVEQEKREKPYKERKAKYKARRGKIEYY